MSAILNMRERILFYLKAVSSIFNQLLDPLPQEYEGYLIRTDYRIGIQIALCAADAELSEYEKAAVMIHLLFGAGTPELNTAMRGVNWFMACGNPPEAAEEGGEQPVFSFDYDAGRIYSAFRKLYGIDISRERMHWFQFCALLGDTSGTAFTDVVEVRQADLAGMDPKTRAAYNKMKRKFRLPNALSEEEQGFIDDYLAKANQPMDINP